MSARGGLLQREKPRVAPLRRVAHCTCVVGPHLSVCDRAAGDSGPVHPWPSVPGTPGADSPVPARPPSPPPASRTSPPTLFAHRVATRFPPPLRRTPPGAAARHRCCPDAGAEDQGPVESLPRAPGSVLCPAGRAGARPREPSETPPEPPVTQLTEGIPRSGSNHSAARPVIHAYPPVAPAVRTRNAAGPPPTREGCTRRGCSPPARVGGPSRAPAGPATSAARPAPRPRPASAGPLACPGTAA